ncbi:transcription initiation factor IIB [Halobellus inordinatus]|uniref:transcription initiation factor IIB n=1 Tax=Halobellus inordinatus TaxID=1126236 RepID=UPI0021138F64|nr:TFIIB-type zinc ribbon-containing protein [Halobellus ramosii]
MNYFYRPLQVRGDQSVASNETMSLRDIYERSFDEESGKTISATTCPECDGQLVTADGETNCIECGLIVASDPIDYGPEWSSTREYAVNPERTGAPVTPARHDRGLSTEIGFGNDSGGKPLSGRKRQQISRLRTQHIQARWGSTSKQNLAYACLEIARMSSALEFPRSLRDEACQIYRAARRNNLITGRSIESLAAGSLYAACRCRGLHRSSTEIAGVARCSLDHVRLGYRVLNAELELETKLVSPVAQIPRLAAGCEVSNRVQHRAIELAHTAEEAGLANGRSPSGVAAACLYLAEQESGGTTTQAEIATLAETTPVTLRERYYELQEVLDEVSLE